MSCHVIISYHIISHHIILYYVILCYIILYYIILYYIILYYIILYHIILLLYDHRRICGPSLIETSLCGAWLHFQYGSQQTVQLNAVSSWNKECWVLLCRSVTLNRCAAARWQIAKFAKGATSLPVEGLHKIIAKFKFRQIKNWYWHTHTHTQNFTTGFGAVINCFANLGSRCIYWSSLYWMGPRWHSG